MRLALMLTALSMPTLASAQVSAARRETVQVLESRSIPRDVAEDVTRVFNTSGTMRLTGDQRIDAGREVTSDVAIMEGTLTIGGRVTGRVVAINAEVILAPTARLERDVTILGGRFDPQTGSVVVGDVRIYKDRVQTAQDADRIVVHDQSDDELWYRRRERWRNRSWSDLRLVSARTYNRVEGLPVLVGPAFGRDMGWGRLTVDVMGILRSADNFEWKSENIGHLLKAEVSAGKRGGIRLGGRLFDIVDPVEPWHLSDAEVGLASFLIHRDYRDYFDRHGGTVYGALFVGASTDLTVSYSDQRWGSRQARSPFTVLRGGQDWRPNPQLDAGRFHLINATWRYDTRNDEDDPWSGWHLVAEYEYGTGIISAAGPSSSLARVGYGRTNYDRGFVDLRRYNRVSPDGQLNFRLVLGSWLSGDELPLQRRFSVGGPGTLPGFDFRRVDGNVDYWQCSGALPSLSPTPAGPLYPAGVPAQCERVALAQIEYRGEIRIDPFGVFDEERDRRRRGWGRGAEWVVFADAGRGWLVGSRVGDVQYGKGELPPLGTFRTDVGIGVRLDDLGLYIAKSVSNPGIPFNFFVRLRPRF